MTSTTGSGLAIDRITQLAIPVRDLARATAFYRDILGLRYLFEAPDLAFFDCAGVRLMLSVPETPETEHHASIIYYAVSDITAAADTLVARGVTLAAPPHRIARMPTHDIWMAFFRDSEDNLLAITSDVPHR